MIIGESVIPTRHSEVYDGHLQVPRILSLRFLTVIEKTASANLRAYFLFH